MNHEVKATLTPYEYNSLLKLSYKYNMRIEEIIIISIRDMILLEEVGKIYFDKPVAIDKG